MVLDCGNCKPEFFFCLHPTVLIINTSAQWILAEQKSGNKDTFWTGCNSYDPGYAPPCTRGTNQEHIQIYTHPLIVFPQVLFVIVKAIIDNFCQFLSNLGAWCPVSRPIVAAMLGGACGGCSVGAWSCSCTTTATGTCTGTRSRRRRLGHDEKFIHILVTDFIVAFIIWPAGETFCTFLWQIQSIVVGKINMIWYREDTLLKTIIYQSIN